MDRRPSCSSSPPRSPSATSRPTRRAPIGEVLNGRQRQLAVSPPQARRGRARGWTARSTSRSGGRRRCSPASRSSRRATASRRRFHRGAGLVLADGDPFRHPRLRAASGGARRARRSRQDLQRRPRRAADRHLQRRAPGRGARRQCARRADGRHAGGEQSGARRRLGQLDDRARGPRPQPRLRLPVEGTADASTATRSRCACRSRASSIRAPIRRRGVSTRCASSSTRGARTAGRRRRARIASFLRQSGTLEGLTDLRRGLVLDVTPELTQRTTGEPVTAGPAGGTPRSGRARRQRALGDEQQLHPQRHGESGLLADRVGRGPGACSIRGRRCSSPRSGPSSSMAPEFFATPKNLVYTRRIVQPVAAAKITGKVSGFSVGVLDAVDGTSGSLDGAEPSGVHHRADPGRHRRHAPSSASR